MPGESPAAVRSAQPSPSAERASHRDTGHFGDIGADGEPWPEAPAATTADSMARGPRCPEMPRAGSGCRIKGQPGRPVLDDVHPGREEPPSVFDHQELRAVHGKIVVLVAGRGGVIDVGDR